MLDFTDTISTTSTHISQAWSFDVLSAQEKLGIRHMINDVIRRLQKASVRPNDFSSRYSELLDRLWQRKDSESQAQSRAKTPNPSTAHPNLGNNNTTGNPVRNGIGSENHPPGSSSGGRAQDINNVTADSNFLAPSTPYNNRAPPPAGWQTGMQDEFSWLDLQAVGELVSGHGNGGDLTTGAGWGLGGGMDGNGFGYYGNGFGGGEWGEFGAMDGGDDVGRFF